MSCIAAAQQRCQSRCAKAPMPAFTVMPTLPGLTFGELMALENML